MPPRKTTEDKLNDLKEQVIRYEEENKFLHDKLQEALKPKPTFFTPIANRLKNTCIDELFIGIALGSFGFYALQKFSILACAIG